MKNSLLIAFFCLTGRAAPGQTVYFHIQFDYTQYWNTVFDAVETDSAYLLVGGYGAPWASDSSYLLRIDKQQATVQCQLIGNFAGSDARQLVLSASGQQALVSGVFFEEEIPEQTGFFVRKLAAVSLTGLATQIYDLPGAAEYFLRATACSDGGWAMTGYTYQSNQTPAKTLLFRCDSALGEVFLKTYTHNPAQNSFGGGIAEIAGEGFIVAGVYDAASGQRQAQLLRFDTAGALAWRKTLEPAGDEENLYLYDVVRIASGDFLAVGAKYYDPPLGPDFERYWALLFDKDGTVLWSKEYGGNDWATWQRIVPTADGNLAVCGYEKDSPAPGGMHKQYGVLSKLSTQGELIWHRRYTASSENKRYDVFHGLTATRDGGFLCAGSVWGDSIVRENAWVLKLDSLGCLEPGCAQSNAVIVWPDNGPDPLSLYPNPASDRLTLRLANGRMIDYLSICDMQGRRLLERTPDAVEVIVETARIPDGRFFCLARSGTAWYIRQFAVVH